MGRNPRWRIHFIGLGCAKNTVDSETALGALLGAGHELVTEAGAADLVLINTCAFIEAARQESHAVIEEVLAQKDEDGLPRVIVMGCLSEREGEGLWAAHPDLDGVIGLGAYTELVDLCTEVMATRLGERGTVCSCPRRNERRRSAFTGPRLLVTPPSYAYLRIAEGCSNGCAYCAIPSIRGPLNSRTPEEIVKEAQALVRGGVRELVLVAEDTTRYGSDLGDGTSLASLLRRLLGETDTDRLRLLYAHPLHLDEETIGLIADEGRVCRYLDLPIQHASGRVLASMNRGYDDAFLDALLPRLRRDIPGLVLRSSVMVGFPGEDEEAFQRLLSFVQAGHFQHLGAFVFSSENGTAAARLPGRVCQDVAAERLNAVMRAQQAVAFAWLESREGQAEEVLVDCQLGPAVWQARSESEAPEVDGIIRLKGTNFSPGGIIRTCLTRRDGYDIWAVARE